MVRRGQCLYATAQDILLLTLYPELAIVPGCGVTVSFWNWKELKTTTDDDDFSACLFLLYIPKDILFYFLFRAHIEWLLWTFSSGLW